MASQSVAFDGDKDLLGLDDPDSLQLLPVLNDLSALIDITHANDSRLFLVEQFSRILVWDGVSPPTVFLDLTLLLGTGVEGGIKSIAFHPDYPNPGFVFIHYTNPLGNSVIARYTVSAGDPNVANFSSGRTLLVVDQPNQLHYGGQLRFGPEGYLYSGFGDGGPQTDPDCHAQRPDTLLGKLIRLDIDQNVGAPPYYGIPADNPFGSLGEPRPEVWAVGLRQPWRFSFDRLNGDLFIADVGQNSREEVDLQLAGSAGGQNYGWRVMEGTLCVDPDPIDPDCLLSTPSCGSSALTQPILEVAHGNGDCSITGGYVYRGSEASSLVGRYLYGDYCSGRLWAAREVDKDWSSELLAVNLPGVLAFGEDHQGRLYLTEGTTLFRLKNESFFADGFESGDASSWALQLP
jgi:hypothetical protein